ncbi:cuticle protein 10.9-like [Panulirus ornatus]|uniref:cuticle protein 10.9-like n=1 Tax=Panulirus ornatus TaxID=150431 RepID=UPI003A8A4FE3
MWTKVAAVLLFAVGVSSSSLARIASQASEYALADADGSQVVHEGGGDGVEPAVGTAPSGYPPAMPYQFAFEIKDHPTANYQNRVEFVEDGVLQGSYSLLSPDGVIRTAVYKDDGSSGFKVTLHEIPTDIDVHGSGSAEDPSYAKELALHTRRSVGRCGRRF